MGMSSFDPSKPRPTSPHHIFPVPPRTTRTITKPFVLESGRSTINVTHMTEYNESNLIFGRLMDAESMNTDTNTEDDSNESE